MRSCRRWSRCGWANPPARCSSSFAERSGSPSSHLPSPCSARYDTPNFPRCPEHEGECLTRLLHRCGRCFHRHLPVPVTPRELRVHQGELMWDECPELAPSLQSISGTFRILPFFEPLHEDAV